MKSFTKDGVRYFTCKLCGKRNWMSQKEWKKKPQKDKNICAQCLEIRRLNHIEAKERSMYNDTYY